MATLQETKEQLLLNKLLQSRNFLDYTGLTYSDIITKVNQKLAADPDFDNFRESAIAQTMIEIFAGAVDLCNHYIERRAEECYFDTARLKSSVILLARQLAYDIQRRVPAEARIKVRLKGDLAATGVVAGDKIQIPQYTAFTGEGNPFILKTMFEYTITSADIAAGADLNTEIVENELTASTTEERITLIQGEIKSAKIPGNTSNQVSQIFQTYRITDKEFSNMYGEQDYSDGNITKVGIGTTQQEAFEEDNIYEIDRRSLLKIESLQNFNFQDPVAQKICLIRTSTDEGIDLKFGDGKYAAKGLDTTSQTIYLQYLATIGSKANKAGVIGNKLQVGKAIKTITGKDISNVVQFEFYSNIIGGSDLESIEAIKTNAPSIYYSLDRVVTKKDYQDYLKTLSSPIVIRNAIAWGEQEEVYNQNIQAIDNDDSNESVLAIKKLFNVVLFSCLGSLYNTSIDLAEFSPIEDTREVTLDVEDSDELIPAQNYMNVFVAQNIVQQIKYQKQSSEGDALTSQRIVGDAVLYPSFSDFAYKTAGDNIKWAVTLTEIDSEDTYTINMSAAGQTIAAINQTSYDAIAQRIQDVLRDESIFSAAIDDFEPFSYVSVAYITDHFEIKLIDNKYKIEKIWDGLAYDYSLATTATNYNIFGLGDGSYENTYAFVGKAFQYSDKVNQVVRQLDQRCQLTVKNIYVSPIIHTFNINGTIYCRSLVDKDVLHTNIKNKIYTWADKNADFNKPIYISNIIELIESFPDVVRADIKLAPRVESPPAGQDTWFNFSDFENYLSDFYSNWSEHDSETIHDIILNSLTAYLNKYTKDSPSSVSTKTKAERQIALGAVANQDYEDILRGERGTGHGILYADRLIYNMQTIGEGFAAEITERSFYYELIYNMYNLFASQDIINSDNWKFEESPDFYELVNFIHKDLAWIIRYNMIDSYGNIAVEKATNNVNNQEIETNVGGGYTIGNEIIQLWMNTQTQYIR